MRRSASAQVGGDQVGARAGSRRAGRRPCSLAPMRSAPRRSFFLPLKSARTSSLALQQQLVDLVAVGGHVQPGEGLGGQRRERLGLLERRAQLGVDRAGLRQGERLGEVPEQLVQLAHDREDLEHRGGRCPARCASPGPPKVSWETFWPAPKQSYTVQPWKPRPRRSRVDSAAEVLLEVGAGLPGRLVDREVGGRREGEGDTAQAEAVAAVGDEGETGRTRGRGGCLVVLGQRAGLLLAGRATCGDVGPPV